MRKILRVPEDFGIGDENPTERRTRMATLMEELLSLQAQDRSIREIRLALRALPAREEALKAAIAVQTASLRCGRFKR